MQPGLQGLMTQRVTAPSRAGCRAPTSRPAASPRSSARSFPLDLRLGAAQRARPARAADPDRGGACSASHPAGLRFARSQTTVAAAPRARGALTAAGSGRSARSAKAAERRSMRQGGRRERATPAIPPPAAARPAGRARLHLRRRPDEHDLDGRDHPGVPGAGEEPDRPGRRRRGADHGRLRRRLGADAADLRADLRQPLRPLRPPAGAAGVDVRPGVRLPDHGAGAQHRLAVRRPGDLGHHRLQRLGGRRLRRRRLRRRRTGRATSAASRPRPTPASCWGRRWAASSARCDPRAPFWIAAALAFANGLYGLFVVPESLSHERRAPFRWRGPIRSAPRRC